MDLIQLISTALRFNIVGDNGYRTRFIGFKSELQFAEYLREQNISYLKGGFFIPLDKHAPATKNFIYYTVLNDTDSIEDYLPIYEALSRLNANRLLAIKYSGNDAGIWVLRNIHGSLFPVPSIQIFEFVNGSFHFVSDQYNYLFNCFEKSKHTMRLRKIGTDIIKRSAENIRFADEKSLADIYVSRLIFDVILGLRIIKGVPADIDFIAKSADGSFKFLEVKEKDLAKTTKGFGLDKHRIEGMKTIDDGTGIPYHLVVREVNNQRERKFENWWSISIKNFMQHVNGNSIPGGYGMRSKNSNNPTFICPVEFFKKL